MSVEPGTYDFTIYQGANFVRVFTWRDEAEALVDLTGYSARMQIRKKIDGDVLADMTSVNGKLVLGGDLGTITASLTSTETAAISNNGVYDLELISGAGVVSRLLQGNVTLSKEVTK